MTRLILLIFLSNIHLFQFAQKGVFEGIVVLRPCNHSVTPPDDTTKTNKFITVNTFRNADLSKCISDTNRFDFYLNIDESYPHKTLSFYFDWETSRTEQLIELDSSDWMQSLYSNVSGSGPYDLCNMILLCKKKKGGFYEVVINDSTRETMWIKNMKHLKFVTWNKINFKNTWGILAVKCYSKNQVLQKPKDSAQIIENPENRITFEILKAKGDWFKVSNVKGEFYAKEENEEAITGWIRYKKDGKLLVDFELY